MTEAIDLILVDLDGTLLDVSERHYRVYSEITKEFGGVPMPKDEYWDLKRKKTKWPVLLPKSGLSAAIEPDFLQTFIPRIEALDYLKLDSFFPDALPTLGSLASKYTCNLVSLRRNADNLEQELEWLDIRKYFAKVMSGHSDSDGYDRKIALIRPEVENKRAVIIGDTEADIVTGKELGLITIAVTSGIRDEQFLRALEPDHMVNHVGEILDLPLFK